MLTKIEAKTVTLIWTRPYQRPYRK